ncbi:MAG: hypothetical protein KME17_27060 [Cyanosarcina radialis HA8281-LM2]|nr:hypothetical protein [Cyanosarcina radialis HA8281-LM2]
MTPAIDRGATTLVVSAAGSLQEAIACGLTGKNHQVRSLRIWSDRASC